MSKRIYPLKAIKYWYAYDIDDVCALYKKYRLHPQTVRSWLKQGLPAIDGKNPTLIYGATLKDFLGKRNNANKRSTIFEEMFCFKCQDAKPPYKKQVKLEHTNGYLKAKAYCYTCKSIMNKSYKLDDYSKLKSSFHVVDVLELYDSTNSPTNTNFLAQCEIKVIEPTQGELF